MFNSRLAVPSLVAALTLLGLALLPSNATRASDPPSTLGLAVNATEETALPGEAAGNTPENILSPLAPAYSGCGGAIAPITNGAYEQQVVELVNAQRLANGSLPPYKRVDTLDAAARYHAADMAQDDYFDHNTYDRNAQNKLVQVCAWNTRVGTYYTGVYGENIAAGYSDPVSVMNGWMNSPGHRANILSGAWEIGVGYSSQGGYYGVYWVQDFGRRTDVYPLVINREAALTPVRSVSLYLYGSGVFQQMRLKNENGAFTGWQPFQANLPWTLSGCNGTKSVTAELKNTTSTVTSTDSINLAVNPALVLGNLPDTLKFIYSIPDQRLSPPLGAFIPQNNGDGCAMPYSVSAFGSWFSLSATSGTTPAPFTVTPTGFDTANPGVYTGSITVTVAGANGSPHSTSLSLDVVDWTVLQTFLPVVTR
jgi:uncharacterized protein YkwD